MNKKYKIAISIILVLVVFRLLLPVMLKHSINWYLANKVESYVGHIEDFNLAILKGEYSIQGLELYEKPMKKDIAPMLSIKDLTASLAWRAVLRKSLLMDLEANELRLQFIDNKDENKRQLKVNKDSSVSIYKTLIPFNIETLMLHNSEIAFLNSTDEAANIKLHNLEISAKNINNNEQTKSELPSHLHLSGNIQKSGSIDISIDFNILTTPLAFDTDFKIEKFELKELNPLLLIYVPLSFTKGRLSLYGEMASKKNQVKGYIKPFVENIDVVANQEIFESVKHLGIELVSAAGNLILRSKDDKTIATKIEFDGKLNALSFDIWDGLWAAIKNAFNEDLEPKIDNTISIKSL